MAGAAATAMNRLSYDVNTYRFDVQQSVGPGVYALGTPAPHCKPCLASDPRVTTGTTGGSECSATSLVDIDSELQNLTRRATNCPTGQFLPWRNPPCAGRPNASLAHYADCRAAGMPTLEDTRLSNPPCTLRGTGWNRWEWLCKDPQERVLMPFDHHINVRTLTKDNHRPHIARPIDPTLALPAGKFTEPEQGEPGWARAPCSTGATGRETFDEPPILHWRTAEELARIRTGR